MTLGQMTSSLVVDYSDSISQDDLDVRCVRGLTVEACQWAGPYSGVDCEIARVKSK